MDTEKKKIFDDFVLKTIFVFNAQQKLSGNTFYFPEIESFDWCAWKDERERDFAIQAVTAVCLKNCLTYFMFSSEAWLSIYTTEEMEVLKNASGGVLPRPSQDPKRKEVAICTYVAKDETFASYSPIIDVLGKRLLGEWQDFSDGEAKSAWQECFV